MARSGSQSDAIVGISAILAVAAVLAINDQFLVSTDLKMYVLGFERARANGQFLPGATGDFARSLGISEYPGGMLFNIPWLIATSVPDSATILAYGSFITFSLYSVVIALARRLRVPSAPRQIAGFLTPIALFLPGPQMLNSVGRYDPSFLWAISSVTATLVLISHARNLRIIQLLVLSFISGSFVFWSNIQFYPVVLPALTLGLIAIIWRVRHSDILRRVTAATISCLMPALLSAPVFLGTYLFSVWQIPDEAVAENVDVPMTIMQSINFALPFPGLGLFWPGWASSSLYLLRTALLLGILGSAFVCFRQGRRLLAHAAVLSTVLVVVYSAIYSLTMVLFDREIGLDPSYVQVFAYPIWILIVVHAVFSRLPVLCSPRMIESLLLPLLFVVLWAGQWTVRNFDTRTQASEYPIMISQTSQLLKSLTDLDQQSGLLTRAIIIQEQFPEQRKSEGSRIRRSNEFSETFLMELSALRVPVLNAYSHMISPVAFTMTNTLFGDGRPSWRQFSLYDRVNFEAMPPLGIRYIVSEERLVDPRVELLLTEPFKINGNYLTNSSVYLYQITDFADRMTPSVRYELSGSTLRIVGSFTSETPVLIPIEFSNCLRVKSAIPDTDVEISRGDRGLTLLRAEGQFDATLSYSNSVFQISNCRIRDFRDYRSG